MAEARRAKQHFDLFAPLTQHKRQVMREVSDKAGHRWRPSSEPQDRAEGQGDPARR